MTVGLCNELRAALGDFETEIKNRGIHRSVHRGGPDPRRWSRVCESRSEWV